MLSRGKVIPVINMRVRFGLEKIPFTLRSRIIVVNINERIVGIIVDSAREYINIPKEKIQPVSDSFLDISSRFLEGIANLEGRLILIINLEEILETSVSTLIQGGIEK
jgi:purine-binding chemotaxis protein CheW